MPNPSDVESLLRRYCDVKSQQAVLSEREKEILADLQEMIPDGAAELTGETLRAVFTSRQNVTYPTKRGQTHPLRLLMAEWPVLGEYVRVTYAESGSKLGDLVARLNGGGDPVPPALEDMVRAVAEVRVVSPGKPAVKVEPLSPCVDTEEGYGR